MRVLVLGAYGLIGSSVADRLAAAGHEIVGLGRSTAAASLRRPGFEWREADVATLTSRERWASLLEGADAVVNCVGALQDGARDRLTALQSDAMKALYQAGAASGVRHLVQISATRASLDASTEFMRTKGEADAALRASGLTWTILRPGLVVAPSAYGGTALVRALAAMPGVAPSMAEAAIVRTVGVDEVAEAALCAIEGRLPANATYDLVEDQPRSLDDVVASFRRWLGLSPAKKIRAPRWLVRAMFRCGDLLGWLGWRPPMRTTALAELEVGVDGDPEPWRAARGHGLRSLEETLARMPSTVQERWFARVFLVKPLAIGVLSLFWIATGLVALAQVDQAVSLLAGRGVAGALATAVVVGGAVLDIVLGLALTVRRTHVAAALGMVALTAGYLVGGTIVAPDLWLDPLGALLKPIPGLVLALFVLAVAEER